MPLGNTLRMAVAAGDAASRRLNSPGPLAVARMGGSSIATPGAMGWVTDFLNAAYYARPRNTRDVDDLRLAFGILTTAWHRWDRRLRLGDLRHFNSSFGAARLRNGPTLGRDQLLEGADRLLGPDFAPGWASSDRRAHGSSFRDAAARTAFDPALRLRDGALDVLTPPRSEAAAQTWQTYRPVPLPSVDRAAALLTTPERWPDFGTELGRFTAVRRGGLPGQTFEIELAARITPRTPLFTRAYVTATRVLTRASDADELDAHIERIGAAMAAAGAGGDRRPMPPGASAHTLIELTTHQGHFLGRGISRLLLFEHDLGVFARDIGSWDPLPPHLAAMYRFGGNKAQHAFWGEGTPEQGLFHQLARAAA